MTITNLSPTVKNLCGRLASERTRPTAWALARDLRRQAHDRLVRGDDEAALIEDLQREIAAAVAAQRRR